MGSGGGWPGGWRSGGWGSGWWCRDPGRAPELAGAEVAVGSYDDRDGLRRAFEGAHTLFMVSASEDPDRMRLHGNVVGAATDAGVGRVVYTSFYGAAPECTFTFGRDHWHTEELIRGSGLRHTFLRDNLYIDFLPLMVGGDGVIRGPAGDGRVAAVARDDIADVAVAVLLDDGGGHDGRSLRHDRAGGPDHGRGRRGAVHGPPGGPSPTTPRPWRRRMRRGRTTAPPTGRSPAG